MSLDDETVDRLHTEFVRKADATSEPDVEDAWRLAARLLGYANAPQRYVVGVDPATTDDLVVATWEGRTLRVPVDPRVGDPAYRPLWEGTWTPPDRPETPPETRCAVCGGVVQRNEHGDPDYPWTHVVPGGRSGFGWHVARGPW